MVCPEHVELELAEHQRPSQTRGGNTLRADLPRNFSIYRAVNCEPSSMTTRLVFNWLCCIMTPRIYLIAVWRTQWLGVG